MTVIIFILALSILIFVHEWGHFIVAKKSGIRVDVFCIGFGPKLFSFTWGGTEYRIAPFPFGGFVKIFGHEPMEEAEGDAVRAKEIAEHPQAFVSKPLWKRLAVVFSGPLMNIILCLLLLPVVYMVGQYKPKIVFEKPVVVEVTHGSPAERAGLQKGDEITKFNDKTVTNWEDLMTQIMVHPEEEVSLAFLRAGQLRTVKTKPVIKKEGDQSMGYLGIEYYEFYGNEPVVGEVQKETPADRAGIRSGDLIVAINGKPIQYWTEMMEVVRGSEGRSLDVTVERAAVNGVDARERMIMVVKPEFSEKAKYWVMGIQKDIIKDGLVRVRHGFTDSVKLGVRKFGSLTNMTLDVLYRLFTGQLSVKVLGGPLQIAKLTSSAAKSSFGDFLFILAFLSLQLGILNLMPIPVLDGGHITFMLIEGAVRRPLPYKFKLALMQVGLVVLMGFMLFVTINDVDNLWGFANIFQKLKGVF